MRLVLGMMACAALTGHACDKYRSDEMTHADDAKINARDNGATIVRVDQTKSGREAQP